MHDAKIKPFEKPNWRVPKLQFDPDSQPMTMNPVHFSHCSKINSSGGGEVLRVILAELDGLPWVALLGRDDMW